MGDFLDQFDKIPTGQKVLLLILLVFGIFVAFYLTVYSSLEEQVASARGEIDTLVDRRAELRAQSDDIERIRRDIGELCERQNSFLEKLPPRAEVSALLESIHQQAQLVGLDIQSFTRQADTATPNYAIIPVQMGITGTYDQISDFFYFIGRQRRIVNVSDIRLSVGAGGTAGGPPRLTVQCLVQTYYADAATSQGGEICGS